MSLHDAAVVVIGLTMSVVALFQLPQMWRGERVRQLTMPSWWPFGVAIWRGLLRSVPLQPFWLAPSFLLMLVDTENASGAGRLAIDLLVVWIMSVWAIWFSIVLWNRPKRLVPPWARDDAGAIQEWRRS